MAATVCRDNTFYALVALLGIVSNTLPSIYKSSNQLIGGRIVYLEDAKSPPRSRVMEMIQGHTNDRGFSWML